MVTATFRRVSPVRLPLTKTIGKLLLNSNYLLEVAISLVARSGVGANSKSKKSFQTYAAYIYDLSYANFPISRCVVFYWQAIKLFLAQIHFKIIGKFCSLILK
jgi:hypothetical protein